MFWEYRGWPLTPNKLVLCWESGESRSSKKLAFGVRGGDPSAPQTKMFLRGREQGGSGPPKNKFFGVLRGFSVSPSFFLGRHGGVPGLHKRLVVLGYRGSRTNPQSGYWDGAVSDPPKTVFLGYGGYRDSPKNRFLGDMGEWQASLFWLWREAPENFFQPFQINPKPIWGMPRPLFEFWRTPRKGVRPKNQPSTFKKPVTPRGVSHALNRSMARVVKRHCLWSYGVKGVKNWHLGTILGHF